jgi:hypothetical protein
VRVLVSVDMEGVAGVVAPEDVSPGQAAYERSRVYMTDEASAAVRGILAHEPDASVVVSDAHARFRNLLPDRLNRRCTLLSGSPRTNGMMTGIDGGVDAVCFVGYHARAGSSHSVLAHTVSGGTIGRVKVDGQELGEIGLNAALAAHSERWPCSPPAMTCSLARLRRSCLGSQPSQSSGLSATGPRRGCIPKSRVSGSKSRRKLRWQRVERFAHRTSMAPSISRSRCCGRS